MSAPSRPVSCTATTLGSVTRARARASRSRADPAPLASGSITSLSAISRSSAGSYASHTTPMPPCPTSRNSTWRPSRPPIPAGGARSDALAPAVVGRGGLVASASSGIRLLGRGLLRDDERLDLRVGRGRHDLLRLELVLLRVRPPRDDLVGVRVADAGQRLQLIAGGAVDV